MEKCNIKAVWVKKVNIVNIVNTCFKVPKVVFGCIKSCFNPPKNS